MAAATTSRWDAVVVGARVAGAATALLLARGGLRVLVVDRARRGSDTLSTHALMRPAVLSLERLGVYDALVAAGTPAIRGVDFVYGDDVETVDLARSGALLAPRRTLLDRVLADAAAAAGACVRYGVTVDDVIRDGTGRVSGVVGRDSTGRPVSARAPLVIGADGARSRIARRVGAAVTARGSAAGGVVYRYVPTAVLARAGVAGDRYRWCYRPGSGAGVIPTGRGRSCVWAGASRERVLAALRRGTGHAFAALLAATAPDLAAALAADAVGYPGTRGDDRVRAFPGAPALVRQPHGPGWALVGDAGLYRDPISSHGISDALRDAQLLAAAVLGADGRRALDGALGDYHAARDAVAAPVLAATEAVAAFDWDLPALREHLLALSAALKAETTFVSRLDPLPRAA
ncbi:MAG TPA: FAD-dependent monooxygenase [Egibacteraceae bacterium]